MTYQTRITEDGRLALPVEIVRAMGFEPGDWLSVDQEDGRLVIRTYADIVREGQEQFRSMLPPGFDRSLVDDMLADRRAEADIVRVASAPSPAEAGAQR